MTSSAAATGPAPRLQDQVFYLEWPPDEHGTGFFISPNGWALTAYHNVLDEALQRPKESIETQFRGRKITLRWRCPGKATAKWQEEHDLAVLEADPPLEGIPVVRCVSFPLTNEAPRERCPLWATHRVIAAGFPRDARFAFREVTGMISADAIWDTKRDVDGHAVDWVSGAIAVLPNYLGLLRGLKGMSGGPLYDVDAGGIVGVVFGVQDRMYATELAYLLEVWPEAREHIEEMPVPTVLPPVPVPPGPRFPGAGVVPLRVAGASLLAIALAVLLWFFWPRPLRLDLVHVETGNREKLRPDMTVAESEKLRIAIRTPVSGNIYLVDQELGRNGVPRQPKLVFPTRRTRGGDNFVKAGSELFYPDPTDDPPFVQVLPEASDADFGGELITVLIFAKPLPLDLRQEPLPVLPGMLPGFGQPRKDPHPEQATGNPTREFEHPLPVPMVTVPIRILVRRKS